MKALAILALWVAGLTMQTAHGPRAVVVSGFSRTSAQARLASQASTAAIPPGNAANGKAVYLSQQCWACHGYNGETGTRLLQEDGSFIVRLLNVGGFINFVRAPRPTEPPPVGSSLSMPSYGVASLSNQQAADLYAYIKTFKPTQPPLQDIPLLNQMMKEGGNVKK
jgi:mono/diheme cytochrome c family protein